VKSTFHPTQSASRRFHTSPGELEPPSSGVCQLYKRRLIYLGGPDAAKFLQGLITNNVDPDDHKSFYSAFLDARGRVLWDVFIWRPSNSDQDRKHWSCYIEVDSEESGALLSHLRRHKLRSKVELRLESEKTLSVWAAWGGKVNEDQYHDEHVVASLVDPRLLDPKPVLRRMLVKGEGRPVSDVSAGSENEYDLLRYTYGIPEGPNEILKGTALPMECNIDLSQGIDFKKGCYVGQELTIRTKHTGVVRKRILPVQLYYPDSPPNEKSQIPVFNPEWAVSNDMPEIGADIKQLDEQGAIKKGRAAGKLIARIGNVGLSLSRLEMMTSMKVSAEGGSWKPGMEFGMQEENSAVVKVKPFVRDHFRLLERNMWDKNRTKI